MKTILQWLNNEIAHPNWGGKYNLADCFNTDYQVVTKVFNEGRGRLQFIHKTNDGIVLVNALLVTKKERELLKPFNPVYIELGYPTYYSKGLLEIYKENLHISK